MQYKVLKYNATKQNQTQYNQERRIRPSQLKGSQKINKCLDYQTTLGEFDHVIVKAKRRDRFAM